MNSGHHKTIFSKRLGCLVAVGEHASSQGKATGAASGQFSGFSGTDWLSTVLEYVGVLTASCAMVSLAWAGPAATALPTGGQVAQGVVSVQQAGAVMSINQSTSKAVVNWNTFDIGQNAKVNIVQPGADAVMLNRVTSANPSQILGQLHANGQVVLVNPNGVLFGKDGSVNANSFTASTLGITDANFMAGNQQFERNGSTAAVVNQGSIKTSGGYVALLGASVSNDGQINTQGGTAYLAAAETVKIPVSGSGRIKLELSPSRINAAVANGKTGTIVTEGGQVYMQAASLSTMVASIIQSGSIDTTGEQGVAVHLLADGGEIKVDGSITANSSGKGEQGQQRKGGDIVIGRDEETGVLAKATNVSGARLESGKGFVETSGEQLEAKAVSVKAKDWLLDPSDITISNSTNSNVTGTSSAVITPNGTTGTSSIVQVGTITDAINMGTSVTIKTTNAANTTGAGNITIVDGLTFTNNTADATLTLIADNGITQNAAITASGSKLVHISMEAKGKYQNNDTANANSKGITLNKTISTNGDVTLIGTNQNTGGGRNNGGVVFNTGSGITAKVIQVTGTQKKTGTTDSNGIAFSGTTTFNSTGASTFNGTSSSIGNASSGVYLEDGATLNLNSGTGSIQFKADNTNAGYRGIRLGYVSPATTSINTDGNVIFGTDTSAKQTLLRANLNVNTGSVTLQASEVQFYDGAVLTAKNGTTVNLTGQTINLGQAGPAVIKKDLGGFDLNMIGNKVMVQGVSSVDVGTGTVSVKTLTPGWEIQLGADDAATKMGLTNAELGLIKAGQVVVGDTGTNGLITVAGVTNANAATGNLTLQTGGNITVSGNLNAGAGKNLTLLAKGDVTVGATINQAGTGNIVLAAGFDKGAGDAAGGLVKRSGSGIVTNTTGKTYIYTGSVSGSTVMGNLNSSFNTLLLDNTTPGSPQNAQSNVAYGSTLGIPGSNTASMQVLYREKIGVNLAGVLTDANKVYGDIGSNTGNTEARAALNAANTFTAWTTAGSSFKIKRTALVDTMSLAGDTYSISATPHLNANTAGYGFTSSTYTLSNGPKLFVAKANLTLVDGSKTYDGQTATLVAGSNGSLTLTGVVGETATLNSTKSVELTSANAGTSAVKGLGSHAAFASTNGLDLNNYNVADSDFAALALASNNAVSIAKANLTQVAGSKTYDGQTATLISGSNGSLTLTGVAGETATLDANKSVELTSPNAGSRAVKSLGLSAAFTSSNGLNLDNYNVTDADFATLSGVSAVSNLVAVAKANLTKVTGQKIYDGQPSLSYSEITAVEGINGEQFVATAGTAAILDKNVLTANNKLTDLSTLTLTGKNNSATELAGNYNLDSGLPAAGANNQVTIRTRDLSANISNVNTTYGTNAGTGSVNLIGVIGPDNVSASAAGLVGTALSSSGNLKAGTYVQSVVGGLTGTDAGNYTFSGTSSANYVVNKLALNTQIAAVSTTYGTTAATGAASITGVLSGDKVDLANAKATLVDAANSSSGNLNAGTYKQTVANSLSGADADNYTAAPTSLANYVVTPKAITATVTAADKVYDGSNVATLTANSADIVSGDLVAVQGASGTFASKNVARDGSGNAVAQTVTVSGTGVGLGGTDGANYTLTNATSIASTTAKITPKDLSVSGITASDKVYDGSTAAVINTANAVVSGLVTGDSVSVSTQSGVGNFASKDVAFDGAGVVASQAVTVSGLSLNGAAAGNYNVSDKSGATAKVLQRALSITGSVAQDKTVDGNTNAQVKPGQLVNLVAGESLVVSATGQFADAEIGTNKAVTTQYALANGANGVARNYTLAGEVLRAAILVASINPVQPIVNPSRTPGGGRVVVSGSGNSGAALGVADGEEEIISREECSVLNPEKCECQESTIAGVEMCFAPTLAANTKN